MFANPFASTPLLAENEAVATAESERQKWTATCQNNSGACSVKFKCYSTTANATSELAELLKRGELLLTHYNAVPTKEYPAGEEDSFTYRYVFSYKATGGKLPAASFSRGGFAVSSIGAYDTAMEDFRAKAKLLEPKYDKVVLEDKKVTSMLYWNKADFGRSKTHRIESEQPISSLELDPKTRKVTVKK